MHKVQLKNYGEIGLLLKAKKMRQLILTILFFQVLSVIVLQAQQFQVNKLQLPANTFSMKSLSLRN